MAAYPYKKIPLMLMIVPILIGIAVCGLAHEPSFIKLSFNQQANSLRIEIRHYVRNPEQHYVNRIEIFVNGQNEGTLFPQNQKFEEFFVIYQINQPDIRQIFVEAYCNVAGTIQGSLSLDNLYTHTSERYLYGPRPLVPQPFPLHGEDTEPDLPQGLQPGFDQDRTEPALPQDMESGFDYENPEKPVAKDMEPGFGDNGSVPSIPKDMEPGFDK